MQKPPSKAEMMQPTNAQGGTPNYDNEASDTPGNPFHRVEGDMDAPKYLANNPRYWEYR